PALLGELSPEGVGNGRRLGHPLPHELRIALALEEPPRDLTQHLLFFAKPDVHPSPQSLAAPHPPASRAPPSPPRNRARGYSRLVPRPAVRGEGRGEGQSASPLRQTKYPLADNVALNLAGPPGDRVLPSAEDPVVPARGIGYRVGRGVDCRVGPEQGRREIGDAQCQL